MNHRLLQPPYPTLFHNLTISVSNQLLLDRVQEQTYILRRGSVNKIITRSLGPGQYLRRTLVPTERTRDSSEPRSYLKS